MAVSMAPSSASFRRKPTAPELRCELGSALLAVGRIDEAIAEFQLAVKLQPDFAAAKAKLDQSLEAKKR